MRSHQNSAPTVDSHALPAPSIRPVGSSIFGGAVCVTGLLGLAVVCALADTALAQGRGSAETGRGAGRGGVVTRSAGAGVQPAVARPEVPRLAPPVERELPHRPPDSRTALIPARESAPDTVEPQFPAPSARPRPTGSRLERAATRMSNVEAVLAGFRAALVAIEAKRAEYRSLNAGAPVNPDAVDITVDEEPESNFYQPRAMGPERQVTANPAARGIAPPVTRPRLPAGSVMTEAARRAAQQEAERRAAAERARNR